MGATRALVTVKKGDVLVYVNDMTAALSFLELFLKVSPAPAVADLEAEQELVDRIVPVSAALQAQQALRAITGLPAHNLGMATHRALQAGSISRAEASTLRGLRRKANSAKHDWSSDGSGGAATSGPFWQPQPRHELRGLFVRSLPHGRASVRAWHATGWPQRASSPGLSGRPDGPRGGPQGSAALSSDIHIGGRII